jgi:hypothetical protein
MISTEIWYAVAELRGSSVPLLAALQLHREAGGIANLDPDRARTEPIGAVDLL